MIIYCLPLFKDEFHKLLKKRAYKNLQEEIINYIFNQEFEQLFSGTRLNGSSATPYIKKRLDGSGGYRLYYLLVKEKEERVYLMFVHPKTGTLGSDNITDESKAKLYKDVLEAIKTNVLYRVVLNDTEICFEVL